MTWVTCCPMNLIYILVGIKVYNLFLCNNFLFLYICLQLNSLAVSRNCFVSQNNLFQRAYDYSKTYYTLYILELNYNEWNQIVDVVHIVNGMETY